MADYCAGAASDPQAPPSPVPPASDEPRAECVLCREPTEYPASTKGATLCPVCEWQEAQRGACSG
ncbi:hypothetical protein ABZY90_38390 [Streptomyces sp. NPDC006422]|uniref:hypothetical protein n=1 Tax=unclassified Streptomyces TaxID=2593676 RepID=UPI0033A079AA